MIRSDAQLGTPQVLYKDTKANIEALTIVEAAIAYATDTNQYGSYNGTTWDWLGAAAFLGVPIPATSGGTGIANGTSATLTLPNVALTLAAAGVYTLTIPATGTAALLNAANVFTAGQKINVNSATAFVVEQDGVKDNVLVVDTTNARSDFIGTLDGLGAGNSNYAVQITANTPSSYSSGMSALSITNNFTGDAGGLGSSVYGIRVFSGNNGSGFANHIIGMKIEEVTNTGLAAQNLWGLYVIQPSTASSIGNSAIHIQGVNGAISFSGDSSALLASKIFSALSGSLTIQSTTLTLTVPTITASGTLAVAGSGAFGQAIDTNARLGATKFVSANVGSAQRGMYMASGVSGSNNITDNVMGAFFQSTHTGSGNVSTLIGGQYSTGKTGTGNITTASGQRLQQTNSNATGVITNSNAIEILSAIATGVITNNIAININDQTGGTNNWAILTNAGNIVFNEGGDANTDIRFESDTKTHMLFLDASVNAIGINQSVPTAQLHLGAGTTAAGTAPLKFTTGSLLTSVEAGAMEFFNNSLWFTNLAVRRTVVQAQSVATADQSIANTTTETTIFTQTHGADYLKVGKQEDIWIQGLVNTDSGAADVGTVRVKYAGTTLGTFTIPKSVGGKNIEIHVVITCRAIGAGTTSIQVHANCDIDGIVSDPIYNGLSTGLDSTIAQATTVTLQWTTASAGDNFTLYQSRALSIDNNA